MGVEAPVILARDLWVKRGEKWVLQGINLQIERSDTLVIIGPSGCGKTTLLRSFIGLIPFHNGELHVLGERVNGFKESDWDRLRLKMGLCFQEGALFDSLTVLDNVAFPLRMHTPLKEHAVREKVAAKLKLMGLEGCEELHPAQLSGGMRRRVGLARALIMDPELILFDEPTTGLDPIRTNSIVELISDLDQQLSATSIVVTHDMAVAEKLATHIGLLNDGKLLALATPEAMREHPDPFVRDFVEGRLSAV